MVEKTYELNVWKRAQKDINKIYKHVLKYSPQNAVMIRERIYDVIDSLEQLPYRFSVYERLDNGSSTTRSVAVWNYIIIYRIREDKEQVVIMRVFHGAKDKKSNHPNG